MKIAYIGDITLGDPSYLVAVGVTMIKTECAPKGLILNEKKCEAITLEGQNIEPELQKFIYLTPIKPMLLGAPFSKGQAIDNSLSSQCNDLERATSRSWANNCS